MKNPFKRSKQPKGTTPKSLADLPPLTDVFGDDSHRLEVIQGEHKITPLPKPKPRPRGGQVVKATKHATYSPHTHRHGGGVVKTIPRDVERLKTAQEQSDD